MALDTWHGAGVQGDGVNEHRVRTARALVRWFRHRWAASLPERLHVHEFDASGSPRQTGAFTRELVSEWPPRGRGARPFTGWDAQGEPLNVDEDGKTIDRFRYWLEWMLLRSRSVAENRQAERLIRWAWMGFDASASGAREIPPVSGEFMEAYLERALRVLYRHCQTEPVRFTICPECRRSSCRCAEKSESQIHAEEVELHVTGPPATVHPERHMSGTAGSDRAVSVIAA